MDLWEFLVAAFAFTILAAAAMVLALVIGFALFLLMRSILGRSDAVRVSRDGEPLPGVPFYTKRGRTIQESVYLETLLTVTLSAKKVTVDELGKVQAGDIWYAASKTVRATAQIGSALAQVQDALDEAARQPTPKQQLDTWAPAQDQFDALTAYDGSVPAQAPLVGNSVREEQYVDTDTTHYLNAAQPLIGSANLTTKLAADGTLSESTATVEDTTLSTVLGALPASELISAFPTPDFTKPAQTVTLSNDLPILELLPQPQLRHEFSLEIERHYVRHVLSRELAGRGFVAPIALADADKTWYRREYVSAEDLDAADEQEAVA